MAAIVGTNCARPIPTSATSLRLELRSPTSVDSGAAVPLLLTLVNKGDQAIELPLIGLPGSVGTAFDIVALDVNGREVWRAARPLPPSTPRLQNIYVGTSHNVTLHVGESVEWWAVWETGSARAAPIRPGQYRLEGSVPLDSGAVVIRSNKRSLIVR